MSVSTALSMNGVLKFGRKGRAKFQLDDETPAFEVDVIEVYDCWVDADWALRNEKGELSTGVTNDQYGKMRQDFVQAVINDAFNNHKPDPLTPIPTITRADAEGFIEVLRDQAKVLRNFTDKKSDKPSSPPENTEEARINFSQ